MTIFVVGPFSCILSEGNRYGHSRENGEKSASNKIGFSDLVAYHFLSPVVPVSQASENCQFRTGSKSGLPFCGEFFND